MGIFDRSRRTGSNDSNLGGSPFDMMGLPPEIAALLLGGTPFGDGPLGIPGISIISVEQRVSRLPYPTDVVGRQLPALMLYHETKAEISRREAEISLMLAEQCQLVPPYRELDDRWHAEHPDESCEDNPDYDAFIAPAFGPLQANIDRCNQLRMELRVYIDETQARIEELLNEDPQSTDEATVAESDREPATAGT